jgi:hypothetical protein
VVPGRRPLTTLDRAAGANCSRHDNSCPRTAPLAGRAWPPASLPPLISPTGPHAREVLFCADVTASPGRERPAVRGLASPGGFVSGDAFGRSSPAPDDVVAPALEPPCCPPPDTLAGRPARRARPPPGQAARLSPFAGRGGCCPDDNSRPRRPGSGPVGVCGVRQAVWPCRSRWAAARRGGRVKAPARGWSGTRSSATPSTTTAGQELAVRPLRPNLLRRVGPPHAGHFGLGTRVDPTEARTFT